MLILGVNKVLKWCQVTSLGRKYTCPTKVVDGQMLFKFKGVWHVLTDYVGEHTHELVEIEGKLVSQPFKK